MKRTTVTQKQIATRAGVSQATVSLVLSGSTSVTIPETTRDLVKGVAHELGYVPQAAARNLVRGRSGNLGLILVNPHAQVFTDPYVPNVMTGVSEVARAAGFRILVEHIEDIDDQAKVGVMLEMIKGGEVAGAILNNTAWTPDLAANLLEEGYPIVTLDDTNHPWNYSVKIDHLAGVDLLIDHLAGLGHERIACIGYGPADTPSVAARLGQYRRSLELRNLPIDERLVRIGRYDPHSGYEAAHDLLEREQFDALYCMNDAMALGAMKAIQEIGRTIPGDIAVVGYDDMRFAAYTSPPLTTVRAPETEQGRRAGTMLIDLVNDREPAEHHVLLRGELVLRGSCGFAERTVVGT